MFPTLLDNLYTQGLIKHRIFSFYLDAPPSFSLPTNMNEMNKDDDTPTIVDDNPSSSTANVDSSVLVLGPPDKNLYQDELIYTDVLHGENMPPQMWFVRLEGVRVKTPKATNILSLCGFFDTPCVALPDTGTSFLTLPSSMWFPIISAITSDREDCIIDNNRNVFCLNGMDGLPHLTFEFKGHEFTIKPQHYMLPNNQISIQLLDFGIQGVQIIILGDVFLRVSAFCV